MRIINFFKEGGLKCKTMFKLAIAAKITQVHNLQFRINKIYISNCL